MAFQELVDCTLEGEERTMTRGCAVAAHVSRPLFAEDFYHDLAGAEAVEFEEKDGLGVAEVGVGFGKRNDGLMADEEGGELIVARDFGEPEARAGAADGIAERGECVELVGNFGNDLRRAFVDDDRGIGIER